MYADIEVKAESDAERLIRWLVRKCVEGKTNCIPKAIALRGAPLHLRKAKAFDLCLNDLVEFNYVRLTTLNRATHIELNPLLLE